MTGPARETDSDGLRFVWPPEGWRPPAADTARAILRVVMA